MKPIAKTIPLAFNESMSYYECICSISNHINNEIIPAINENSEEIINLKNYVDNNMLTKNVDDLTYYTKTSDLSPVSLTGDYDDLSNKPTIPTVPTNISAFNNDSGYITKNVNDLTNYTLTSNLSSVATSGNYNDLSNKPTIPTVPTNISAFNNDSGYITKNVNDLTNYTLTSNLSTVATTGNYNDLSNKPTIPTVPTNVSAFNNDSGYITKNVNDLTNYTLTSNLSTVATTGSYNDLSNKPTIPIKMVILKYGTSTWNDFITAYNENAIVYCRASSNSNPATSSQTRLAFMAYVNNETTPTSVEFQYYRSVSSHSDSQQGDQVFVYTLTNTNGGTWTVTTRNTFSKVVAGTDLSSSYSSGTITLNNTLRSSLSTVATSGSYNDLSNKPIIPNTFSTSTEQIVGTWIDGKPIYQKVFTLEHTAPYNDGFDHNITNIDKIWINHNASFIYQKDSSSLETLPTSWFYSTSDWVRTWVNMYQIRLNANTNYGTRTLYVVLNYTKTTD